MAENIQEIRKRLATRVEEIKAQTIEEAARRRDMARQEADETLLRSQYRANQLRKNASFRNIFFLFNNLIYQVFPDERIEPFIASSFDVIRPEDQAAYNQAWEAYQQAQQQYLAERRSLEEKIGASARRLRSLLKEQPLGVSYPAPWAQFRQTGQLATIYAVHPRGQVPLVRVSVPSLIRSMVDSILRPVNREIDQLNRLERAYAALQAPAEPQPPTTNRLKAAIADIVTDLHENRMYWARWAAPFAILYTDLDERKPRLLYTRDEPVTSLAITEIDGQRWLYWMEGNHEIHRGRTDGSTAQTLVLDITAPDKGGLWQLEIDAINHKLYWTNDISIWRANLDGSDNEMVISPSESPFPIDLAVDGRNGYLYWIDKDLKMLRRSDLDGVLIEDLYPIAYPAKGLKVDPVSGLLYWADRRETGHHLLRGDTQDYAILLDGTREYIDLGDIRPGDACTFELLLTYRDSDQATLLAKYSHEGTAVFVAGCDRGKLWARLRGQRIELGSIAQGYQHLALVLDARAGQTQIQAYRNGDPIGSGTVSAVLGALDDRPWLLGAALSGPGHSDLLQGSVKEVRVWDQARLESQLKEFLQYPVSPQQPGLIRRWLARDLRSGVVAEQTGLGRFAVVHEAKNERSLLVFDGPGDTVQLPAGGLDAALGCTVECWVYPHTPLQDARLFRLADAQDATLLTCELTAGGQVSFVVPGQPPLTGGAVAAGSWTHIALGLLPDGGAELYVQGKVAATASLSLSAPVASVVLGQGLRGYMAEYRLWQLALGTPELAAAMHRQLIGNESSLYACWRLDTGRGLQARDMGPQALHGVISEASAAPSPLLGQKEQKEAELAAMRQQLAATPATIQRRISVGFGSAFTLKVPNPAYSSLQNSIAALQIAIQALAAQIAALRGGESQRWTLGIAPIGPAIQTGGISTQIDALVHVPGVDGMALVYKEEYALVQRKKALVFLEKTRERVAQEQAAAREQAMRVLAEATARSTAEKEQARLYQIEQQRKYQQQQRDAVARKQQAIDKSKADLAQAKTTQEQRVAQAEHLAAQQRTIARQQAESMKEQARRRHAEAEREYERAKRAR